MINKQKQWRSSHNKVFRFNRDLDKSYRLLFGPTNKAGCVVCGEDEPSVLDIHEADDSHEFKVLCGKCYGAPRQSFDNNLQKQLGGVNV